MIQNAIIYNGFKSTCTGLISIPNNIKKVYKPVLKPEENPIFDLVIRLVCEKLKVNREDVLSRSRKADFVGARTIIFYILCKYGDSTLKEIGRMFGKDHSTIIYARDTCQDYMDINKKYKRKVDLIIDAIKIEKFL